VTERRDVNDVGIRGMHANASDGLSIHESHVFPGLAGVDSFVDAIALHDVAAQFGLTHADVDDIGIRF